MPIPHLNLSVDTFQNWINPLYNCLHHIPSSHSCYSWKSPPLQPDTVPASVFPYPETFSIVFFLTTWSYSSQMIFFLQHSYSYLHNIHFQLGLNVNHLTTLVDLNKSMLLTDPHLFFFPSTHEWLKLTMSWLLELKQRLKYPVGIVMFQYTFSFILPIWSNW